MVWAAGVVAGRIPFVPNGRTRDGLDCWGLACLGSLECFGRRLPEYLGEYSDVREFDRIDAAFRRHLPEWREVTKGEEVPGDLVLLRMRGRPIHVGFVVKRGLMVHTEKNVDVCVESYGSVGWKNRVLGFYRGA